MSQSSTVNASNRGAHSLEPSEAVFAPLRYPWIQPHPTLDALGEEISGAVGASPLVPATGPSSFFAQTVVRPGSDQDTTSQGGEPCWLPDVEQDAAGTRSAGLVPSKQQSHIVAAMTLHALSMKTPVSADASDWTSPREGSDDTTIRAVTSRDELPQLRSYPP